MTENRQRRKLLPWLAASVGLVAIVVTVGVATALTIAAGGSSTATDGLAGMPDMAADTRTAYEAAPSHRDLFAHLPCYCGCALLKERHRSLERCFLQPDGSFEAHASGCRICTDIAIDALAMEAQGLGHTAIRSQIDEKYARAGPPTDTPLP